ncbi:hypothetical protein MMC11_005573 [Xylographa trunciseda]|nr:hypothetical protein [Xylographa trunciseda]
MQRRDSFAQRTLRRLTIAYERLTRRHTIFQGFQQSQQRQDQQRPEQQQREEPRQSEEPRRQTQGPEREQCETRLEQRRFQRFQNSRDNLEHENSSVENEVSHKTHISRSHDTGTQTECTPAVQNTETHAEVSSASQSSDKTQGTNIQSMSAAAIDPVTIGAIQTLAEQKIGRVVVIADSVTGCPIVLLTRRLVYVMNEIRSKRGLEEQLTEDGTKFVHEVQAGRLAISLLEEELVNEDISDEQRALLEQKKNDAEAALEISRTAMLRTADDQQREKRDLIFMREEFLNTMEEALSDANILDIMPQQSDTTRATEQSLGHESQASDTHQSHESDNNAVGDDNDQEENRTALENLEAARQLLEETQEQFDAREEMYFTDREEYHRAVEAGSPSITTTLFDLTYYQNVSKLTGCLREIEEYYENALKEARRLGLVVPEDYEGSYLASWSSDGYRMSQEAEWYATVPIGKIEKWREQTSISSNPEPAGLGTQNSLLDKPQIKDFDDWDAKTVGTSESWDARERNRRLEAVDKNLDPFYRKRIDFWQGEMDHVRAEWIQSHPPESNGDTQ